MVDLIKEIGKDQGFTVEVNAMTFSTLIAALQANPPLVVDSDAVLCCLRRSPPSCRAVGTHAVAHPQCGVHWGPEGIP